MLIQLENQVTCEKSIVLSAPVLLYTQDCKYQQRPSSNLEVGMKFGFRRMAVTLLELKQDVIF